MKRINLLDESTSNKIAAGEVIERPFSVVKELLENSIDAKSKNITIEIKEGGQKYIKIIDNGHGIHPDDIEKAFMPHATSKIKTSEDIFKVSTLGFRGEALASVASVSKTYMKTRVEDINYGKEIYICGGNIEYIKDAGLNVGTSIEVKDLFFNVPARQKFLKSSQRESALISDIVTRLALANSDISFKLHSNDRKVLSTYGNNELCDTIRELYGKSTYDNIISFEGHSDIATVYGYIGNAEISRKSRNKQTIFVNKRYIKSGLITAAVENAFKSFLTVNKFPFFVLFLDIYPEFIDVNVHPTKSEIKISCDRHIYKLVFDTVHKAIAESLKDSFYIPTDDIEDEKSNKSIFIDDKITNEQIPIDLKSHKVIKEDDDKINNFQSTDDKKVGVKCDHVGKLDFNNEKETTYVGNSNAYVKDNVYNKVKKDDIINNEKFNFNKQSYNPSIDLVKEESSVETDYTEKFPELNVIGQFNKSYILAQYNSELYIIDQHAAHEKILFEKYKKEILKQKVVSQVLITPLILELSNEDFVYYTENEKIFKEIGFDIEIFSDNSLYIREVPTLLGDTNFKELFFTIVDNLKAMGSGKTDEIKYHKIATLACKAAVKANNKLTDIEMKALINDLRFIDEPFTCPHGRPTIIKITLNELEKKFKRIQ
ncbi:DNA mismatch repair endonuclease MutL [Haloimpatiens sp. FM7330]|uniref:DNA mismatch repair endonuclease MutL n=1 Tax=Haloimpatiens sp. FM7330 TaxID=3298610 RepID=UPI0036326AF3